MQKMSGFCTRIIHQMIARQKKICNGIDGIGTDKFFCAPGYMVQNKYILTNLQHLGLQECYILMSALLRMVTFVFYSPPFCYFV